MVLRWLFLFLGCVSSTGFVVEVSAGGSVFVGKLLVPKISDAGCAAIVVVNCVLRLGVAVRPTVEVAS